MLPVVKVIKAESDAAVGSVLVFMLVSVYSHDR